jgi:hypothetical protein
MLLRFFSNKAETPVSLGLYGHANRTDEASSEWAKKKPVRNRTPSLLRFIFGLQVLTHLS